MPNFKIRKNLTSLESFAVYDDGASLELELEVPRRSVIEAIMGRVGHDDKNAAANMQHDLTLAKKHIVSWNVYADDDSLLPVNDENVAALLDHAPGLVGKVVTKLLELAAGKADVEKKPSPQQSPQSPVSAATPS